MNLFEKIRELKFPFIAVVAALTFGGLVAPANAVVYASNVGSLVDPERGYTYGSSLNLDGQGQANFDLPASIASTSLGFNYYLSQADSDALAGQTISFEFDVVKTGTSTAGQVFIDNPIVTHNNQNVARVGTGVNATYTWPASAASNNGQRIALYPSGNANFGSVGNYTVTFRVLANGQPFAISNSSTFYASYSIDLEGVSGGTLPVGTTLNNVSPGTVCVNPTLIVAGDVLTARAILDGTSLSNVNRFPSAFWKGAGGSTTVASMTNVRTVSSSDVNGGLAFKSGSFSTYDFTMAGGTAPTSASPFSFDLSITNSLGTEVTYPCPTPVLSAPVVTSSSASQIVVTATGATECFLRREVSMNGYTFFQVSTTAQVNSGTCILAPMIGNFTAGNYQVSTYASGFLGSVNSTSNPTFTISQTGVISGISGGSGGSGAVGSSASVRNPAPAFNINSRPTVSANGQMLTLNGENLGDVNGVKVAGKEAKISKKANGELVIEVPAGTEGFPDVEVLHSGGTVSMQGLIQVLKPYAKVRTQTITQFVGNRPTLAGLAALEQAYLAGTTANVLTCVATVASDASAAEITATEKRAKATCQRVVNYSKYIKSADVHISKDGAAGSKPVLAVTFDRTLDGK